MLNEKIKQELIKEAKRIEEDSLYSSKGHFCAAQFWSNLHLWLGVPTAILAAVAGVSALVEFNNHTLIAGLLAMIVSALSAISVFLNPNEKANSHHDAGNQYNALRNSARMFSGIYLDMDGNDESILKEIKEMSEKRNILNQKSPQIPKRAFKKARRGIGEGEADYEVDSQG